MVALVVTGIFVMRRYCCKVPCTTSTTSWLMMLMPLFIISSSLMYELVCVSLIVRPLNCLLTTSYIGTAAVSLAMIEHVLVHDLSIV